MHGNVDSASGLDANQGEEYGPRSSLRREIVIPDFRGLSDFEEGTILTEIQQRFATSAQSIMFGHDLVFHQFCEPRIMQITSLELYLCCAAWPDPNTDRNLEQLNQGTWYVPPDRVIDRIDITSGFRCENIYCGLLIREIEGFAGPSLALRQMIRGPRQERPPFDWKWLPIEMETVDQMRGRDVFRSGPLRLIPRKSPRSGELWIGPRVGLKEPDHFKDAPLRIATRNVRGRMQRWPIS
jgi:hypothetical protein